MTRYKGIFSVSTLAIFLFVFSLSLDARYRFEPNTFHVGGAEYAIGVSDIGILAVLFAFVLQAAVRRTGIRLHFDYASRFAVIYVIFSSFSLLNTSHFQFTILELVRELKMLALFFALREFFIVQRNRRAVVIAVAFAYGLQALVGAYELASGVQFGTASLDIDLQDQTVEGLVRITGTLGHPNMLAQFVNSTWCLIFVGYLFSRGTLKVFLLIAYVFSFLLVVLSFSRAGIVVYIFSTVIAFRFLTDATGKPLYRRLGGGLIVLIGLMTLVGGGFLFEYVATRFIEAPESSTSARWMLAQIAVQMFQEHPLFGVGLNSFTEIMSAYDETGISYSYPMPVHNVLLLVLAETGTVGLAGFLVMNVYFLALCVRAARQKDDRIRAIAVACGVSLLSISMSGMLQWTWRMDSIQGIYWVLLALIASLRNWRSSTGAGEI